MTQTQTAIAKEEKNIYESLALRGDLSGLKPEDKAQYYSALCTRLGLDPATQPFALIKLNGKEVMYAKKDCTDQLARIHNVNRQIVKEEHIADAYVVTVEATLPNGRKEQSKGAVTLGQLKGDAFCNAIMKAETKAKRRATLSILGLGMLDETEIETIPQVYPATKAQLIDEARSAAESRTDISTEAEAVDADQRLADVSEIRTVCKELMAAGDDVPWATRKVLTDYAAQLFGHDVKTHDDLTDEEVTFLLEDLKERLDSLR